MKKYKIEPDVSIFLGKCYRIYKKVFFVFWLYVTTEKTMEEARKTVKFLQEETKYG